MRNVLMAAACALVVDAALAHSGHGFTGAHWHPSDLFGLGLLAIGAGALWWGRRK
jgi:hypothetical protein